MLEGKMASQILQALLSGLLLLVSAVPTQSTRDTWTAKSDASKGDTPILQESIINLVNSRNDAGWVAGQNERLKAYSVADFGVLTGTYMVPANELDPNVVRKSHANNPSKLPANFDAREKWPSCSSISEIRDQGHCGSCWAFGAVEVLTDRFCIFGHEDTKLSTNDLLSCCGFECGDGCNGGYPLYAWQYFKRSGVVSSKCDPYFDQNGCHHPGCSPVMPTPKCVRKCIDNEKWEDSKHYGVSAYTVGPDPHAIMEEIFENGPVEVAFSVYEDFAHYKSGVYKHVAGGLIGGHAVKLIGWGTENGKDYWICANSWNKSWGEDGYFKIARGNNECNIEGNVVAGYPDVHRHHHKETAKAHVA